MTIYCSIDTSDLDSAIRMADQVVPAGCGLKLGMEFFNANGPQGVIKLREKHPDASLFIDLKYHDIPNTVAGALRAITRLGPDFLNVHASGGAEMMRQGLAAMKEETRKHDIKMPKLLAVTVLTSMDDEAVTSVGWQLPVENQVKRLAMLTKNTGLNGVVCSPLEIKMVRENCGPGFITMVPGIRPVEANDDQKRTMTPKEAMAAGATHLVIGRPITQSRDPGQTAADIVASLA
jgi:orotidine-5'-phosphate decarboxylase